MRGLRRNSDGLLTELSRFINILIAMLFNKLVKYPYICVCIFVHNVDVLEFIRF